MKKLEKQKQENLVPLEYIVKRIFWIRGKKVMLDSDLAGLYGVETKVLNQAVRRNPERFPEDFMFRLTDKEMDLLRSQSVTSNENKALLREEGRGGRRYNTYAFTEQGVAMLSSVLKSKRAIEVNIYIVRTFVQLREMLATHKELAEKIEKMERKYDRRFRMVFDVMRKLLDEKPEPSATMDTIGFRDRRPRKK
jgi:DNA-binding PadR family transcriptional regulator